MCSVVFYWKLGSHLSLLIFLFFGVHFLPFATAYHCLNVRLAWERRGVKTSVGLGGAKCQDGLERCQMGLKMRQSIACLLLTSQEAC